MTLKKTEFFRSGASTGRVSSGKKHKKKIESFSRAGSTGRVSSGKKHKKKIELFSRAGSSRSSSGSKYFMYGFGIMFLLCAAYVLYMVFMGKKNNTIKK